MMEQSGDREEEGDSGDRQMKQTSKNNREKKKKNIACVHTNLYTNNRSDLSPFFLCMFILHLLSLYPFSNRFSYPPRLLLCFCFLFLPYPTPPRFCFFNAFLFPSLAHLCGTPCLGAIAANQTVYPSLISALPHGGFCPLKTMKVSLSAEPGM